MGVQNSHAPDYKIEFRWFSKLTNWQTQVCRTITDQTWSSLIYPWIKSYSVSYDLHGEKERLNCTFGNYQIAMSSIWQL